MFDPIFEEICRAKGPAAIQGTALRRWQEYLRDVADPMMKELADLRDEQAKRNAPKLAGASK